MKKIPVVFVLLVLTLCAPNAHSLRAQGDGPKIGNVKVLVDGFQNDEGFAKIGLCNTAESFKNSEEKAVINTTTKIVRKKAQHVFEGVPFGTYAVTVYHDENANGKLDKGAFGKPLELYGFSNNARGIFSRPAYEKAAFMLDKAEMTVHVTVE